MARYRNLDGSVVDKGFGDIFRWAVVERLSGKRRWLDREFETPRRENDGAALKATTPHMTWIGHATFAARLGGAMIVTDPIFSRRIQGTIPRLTPPGVAMEKLPHVDIVTVSHAHYDHLDLPTLVKFPEQTLFVVPKDVGEILTGAGIRRVVELEWWGSHEEGGVKITLVPAQHWSMRSAWDKNRRLWGGYVYETKDGVAYHAGDTAFSEGLFRAIHDRCPRIDWAMIPIGAYEPVWFMGEQHIGPEDAGRAWEILEARIFCAMHWGTFRLTDEPLGEPPARVRAWFEEKRYPEERLWIFDVGETRRLS
jgi:L-ascorbate metabolism protein UlaG (beta-lactamase superfamily)